MKKEALFAIGIISCLLLTAFTKPGDFPKISGRNAQIGTGPEEPALIIGEFEYSNEFVVETYYVEHAVGLLDMTGFVLRDQEWELPVEGQVLGYMDLDADNNRAVYRLALPAVPQGIFNDVDNDSQNETGLQIFAIAYNPNLTGGVFSEGDDRTLGWPGYLASVKTDSENQDEVIGGKLVIWAADGDQGFPSGFGDDGLLFSGDDPIMAVPGGYSIVDLDSEPFKIERGSTPEVALYEPEDIKIKDFSDFSYTEAFDSMFEIVQREYAFNGVEGKQPDWDALYQRTALLVENAEEAGEPYSFYLALREFSMAFMDGHVGLSGGEYQRLFNENNILGGWGFSTQELDDGRVIVVYVLPDGPADKVGMEVGAELIQFNDLPVQTALDNVKPFQPQSTDFGLRHEQIVFLTRAPIGEKITVEFINPPGSEGENEAAAQRSFWAKIADAFRQVFSGKPAGEGKQARMTSIYELESLFAVYQGGTDEEYVLPSEYELLSSGVGYIQLNSNYDDLALLVRVFERALQSFETAGVPGIVIDLRLNYGGAPMGLAGFFHDEEILLGQLEYYSDKTGRFEPEGLRDKVYPNENQYRFERMVLLVDQFCYSACEIEAYGLSQVPGMVVMGQYPTAGVEAETARGQFLLPEGIEFNIPTGRFTNPDGSIFLEGQGVQPTILLPISEASVLSNEDAALQEAVDYILGN